MMKGTYIFSRAFESMPFIKALRQNEMDIESIHLSNNQFALVRYLEKFMQSSRARVSDSFIIIDDPGIPATVLNIKKILKFNENDYMIRLRGDSLMGTRAQIVRNAIDYNIDNSNALFHVAKYLEKKYKKLYPSKRHYTVYNGINLTNASNNNDIDISKYSKLTEKTKINILTVMNFDFSVKFKYIKSILPIIKRIINEYSASFVFIGGGKYLSELKSSFYGQKGVVFLGKLPRNEVLKLMPYFDIFFYPSGLDILPNAVLEASVSGLPVISTSVGGISEIIVDKTTGFLLENIKKDSYTYLKLLIEDEGLRYQISTRGREYVTKKFDWNVITTEFVKIIKSEIKKC